MIKKVIFIFGVRWPLTGCTVTQGPCHKQRKGWRGRNPYFYIPKYHSSDALPASEILILIFPPFLAWWVTFPKFFPFYFGSFCLRKSPQVIFSAVFKIHPLFIFLCVKNRFMFLWWCGHMGVVCTIQMHCHLVNQWVHLLAYVCTHEAMDSFNCINSTLVALVV